MRRSRQALILGLASAALAGCTEHVEPVSPTLRQISYGFESLAGADWAAEATRLRAAGADAVSLSAGRPEWTAFVWSEHPDARPASADGDLLAPAIRALDGFEVTLTVDALMPDALAADPSLAGVGTDGERSREFASAAALEGELGDRIVAYAAAVAERYEPDFVALTELMFDDATFGDADLVSYRAHTGADDWPRVGGRIDAAHESIGAWRSAVVAQLVARAADAVRQHGAQLAVDVRVDYADPARGRPDAGHDYVQLAAAADRLVLWHFFDVSGAGPADVTAVTRGVRDAGIPAGQVMVQTGLWADGGGAVPPSALQRALESSATFGVTQVSVAPASLLDDDGWAAVAAAWG